MPMCAGLVHWGSHWIYVCKCLKRLAHYDNMVDKINYKNMITSTDKVISFLSVLKIIFMASIFFIVLP